MTGTDRRKLSLAQLQRAATLLEYSHDLPIHKLHYDAWLRKHLMGEIHRERSRKVKRKRYA